MHPARGWTPRGHREVGAVILTWQSARRTLRAGDEKVAEVCLETSQAASDETRKGGRWVQTSSRGRRRRQRSLSCPSSATRLLNDPGRRLGRSCYAVVEEKFKAANCIIEQISSLGVRAAIGWALHNVCACGFVFLKLFTVVSAFHICASVCYCNKHLFGRYQPPSPVLSIRDEKASCLLLRGWAKFSRHRSPTAINAHHDALATLRDVQAQCDGDTDEESP